MSNTEMLKTGTIYIAGATPDVGSVWEVTAPDGEILPFLIVERHDGDEPIPFVRAIPLSDGLRLVDTGDSIVTIDGRPDLAAEGLSIQAAHCWLEGPVLVQHLRGCLATSISQRSWVAVIRARAINLPVESVRDEYLRDFRRSLYEQFNPVFIASWAKLRQVLDQAQVEATK